MRWIILLVMLILLIGGCTVKHTTKETQTSNENLETATFAGGCFWCIEAAMESQEGVAEAISGYTGGDVENPTYEQVTTGTTGHYEAVQIKYDADKASYKDLVDFFLKQINPTDAEGQFTDRGSSYQTAIFYHTEEQKRLADQALKDLADTGKFDKPIVTKILPAEIFYRAEEYHQDYSQKQAIKYKLYEVGSGRKRFVNNLWK